jgi:hypothetical protein
MSFVVCTAVCIVAGVVVISLVGALVHGYVEVSVAVSTNTDVVVVVMIVSLVVICNVVVITVVNGRELSFLGSFVIPFVTFEIHLD